MVTGDNMAYISGTAGRPVPHPADQRIRPAHTPTRPKPTGLDWDAITPTCAGCGTKSGQLGAGSLCPTCRGVQPPKPKKSKKRPGDSYASYELPEDELLRRFTAPDDTRLGEDLAALKVTDPAVATAAETLDDATTRIITRSDTTPDPSPAPGVAAPAEPPAPPAPSPPADEGDDHGPASAGEAPQGTDDNVTPLPGAFTPEANLDAQCAHADRVLRATANATDPVVRLLRLNATSAIEALHLYVEMHLGGYPATQTPVEPNPPGLGGTTRPAARTQGEGTARPVTPKTRNRRSRLDPHRDAIIRDYQAGISPTRIGATHGVSDVTVRAFLTRNGITLRNRSEAQKTRTTPYPTGETSS